MSLGNGARSRHREAVNEARFYAAVTAKLDGLHQDDAEFVLSLTGAEIKALLPGAFPESLDLEKLRMAQKKLLEELARA